MSRGLWLLLGGLAGAALVPLVLGGDDLFGRLGAFPPGLLLLMLGMILIGWTLNAWRLRLLLGTHPLGAGRALGAVMATEFAICATPAGAGGPLTLMALLRREGVSPARGTAIFAVEQLCDLLFFVCALLGVLGYGLTHALDSRMAQLLAASTALIGIALVLLGLLGRFHRQVLRLNGRLVQRLGVSAHRQRRWARALIDFRNALRAAFRLPTAVLSGVFAITVVHWLLRYSVLYLALRGLGSELAWAWTFLVQMVALSAGQLSLLPGGAGSAELASAALLTPLVGASVSAAAIVIWRFVTYHFYLLAGAPVFLALAGRPFLARLVQGRQS